MERPRRDVGWAWVVLVAAFLNLIISAIPFCVGVYVNEIILELNVPHATGGLFGALQLATLYLGGPATHLAEKLTHRVVIFSAGLLAAVSIVASIYITDIYVLFFTFATLPGFCIGVIFIQSMIVVNRYFDKYAGIANSFSLSGCVLGTILFPYVYDVIIEEYSWRKSLYIVAGITLQSCIFASTMRPIELPAMDDLATKSQELLNVAKARKSLYGNPKFYIFLVKNILWSASMAVVFVLGANLFYERHMSNEQISTLLALIGFGNIGVRIVLGLVLHLRRWNTFAVDAATTLLQAASIALFVVNSYFVTYAIACFLFGISYGSTTVMQAVVSRSIAGIHHYGAAYSFVIGSCVIGITGGPPLTGYIYDKTKSYETAFLVNSGFALSAAIIMTTSFLVNRRKYPDVESDNVEVEVESRPMKGVVLISNETEDEEGLLRDC